MDSLVSVAWLFDQLGAADLAVLDATLPPMGVVPKVDTAARYREEHLPGAVFFDIEALSDRSTSLPHMLPPAEEFGAAMGALGISETMRIVVYEQQAVFSAPRAWWMLRTLGAPQVAVLDGGLPAWQAAGLPLESGPVTRRPVTFRARLETTAVRSFAQVKAVSEAGGQIVDARSAGRFNGLVPEPRAELSSGHMPGAVNVPYAETQENGLWKTPAALRELFAAKGIDAALPVITTCGSGVTAAVLSLALERSGAKKTALYDGSWTEYAQQPGAAIVKA